ncbi:MAG TPA: MarR family transcriptional regulator [Stellaceae bacterium]|nr:MarR family transcriptional regulator [Stellaceae bacterium]
MPADDERHIGFLISDVARLLRTAFDRRVRGLGLTRSQWLVINRLYRRPGATQSELAEMLEVEKATAGRMVDRMEKKGWVVRRPDAADRRVNRLHLTAEADLIQVQLAQIADGTVDDALARLSQPEREQFSEWMRQVKRQLQMMLDPDLAAPIPTAKELVP